MDDLVEVRITAPDDSVAARLAAALVDEGLAACVQIVPGIRSVYRWEGQVEVADEHLLLAKTIAPRFDALAERVRAEHPYDVPEILAIPVTHSDEAYAAWLRSEATPRSAGRTS